MSEDALLLNENDVRAVVRLVAEALAPDDGRGPKCRRIGDGLARLIDADGWIWIRTRIAPGKAPANIDFIAGGAFDTAALAEYADWSLEVHGEPPEHPPVKALLTQGNHFTCTRPDVVPDAIWQSGRCRAHVQRFNFDAWMYSMVPLAEMGGDVIFSGILMLRHPDRPDFDRRQSRIVHLVFRECEVLHRDGLAVQQSTAIAALTPRLHSVLTLLIDGQSIKQIAYHLQLSPHTVNGYVKQIYRHFDVQSRAELLRRFMTGKSG